MFMRLINSYSGHKLVFGDGKGAAPMLGDAAKKIRDGAFF